MPYLRIRPPWLEQTRLQRGERTEGERGCTTAKAGKIEMGASHGEACAAPQLQLKSIARDVAHHLREPLPYSLGWEFHTAS